MNSHSEIVLPLSKAIRQAVFIDHRNGLQHLTELARAMGKAELSMHSILRTWEHRKSWPTLKVLAKVADALGMKLVVRLEEVAERND